MAKSKRRKCVCGRNYVPKERKYCFACESARDPLPPPTFRDIENTTKDAEPKIGQIIFAFKNGVSRQKKNVILGKIRSWKEIKSVEPVFDETDTNASSIDLYAVRIKRSNQVDSIVNKLRSISEIKYAYLPSPRRSK